MKITKLSSSDSVLGKRTDYKIQDYTMYEDLQYIDYTYTTKDVKTGDCYLNQLILLDAPEISDNIFRFFLKIEKELGIKTEVIFYIVDSYPDPPIELPTSILRRYKLNDFGIDFCDSRDVEFDHILSD